MTTGIPGEFLAGAVAGFAIGVVYFLALMRTVRACTHGGSVGSALVFTIFRIALALAAFWLIAQWGATALGSAAIGFACARFAPGRPEEAR